MEKCLVEKSKREEPGPQDSQVKAPPVSIEAEECLLGGLFADPEAITRVAGIIAADDFYSSVNRTIYLSILNLYEKDTPVDLVTVSSDLNATGRLREVGGLAYLNRLIDNMPTSAHLEAYADIIREKSTMRSVITAAHKIQVLGYEDQTMTSQEYLDRAETLIFSIDGQRERKKAKKVYDILVGAVPRIERLWTNQKLVTGIPTGFEKIDLLTAGFQPADMIVIAARPAMGKTALALSMAQSAAENNIPAGIFSLEMSMEQLSMRFLAMESDIPFSKIRIGDIDEDQWKKLGESTCRFQNLPIYIDDSPALSILDLRGRARRMVKEHGVGVIFIDYLQLIKGNRENDRREKQISEISRFLKALAKELNIPVVALSQLNRKVEERHDKRPQLSDIRESGAIEQDADVIMFLYRDEVYNPSPDNPRLGTAELNIGKQRNGPVGTVELGFQGSCTRFFNLYREDEESEPAEEERMQAAGVATEVENLVGLTHTSPSASCPADEFVNEWEERFLPDL